MQQQIILSGCSKSRKTVPPKNIGLWRSGNLNESTGNWKCKNYIGLGPGASGYINNVRYNNVKDLDDYHDKLSKNEKPIEFCENLTEKDKIEEKIIMGLRMNDGIIFKDFEEFGINFEEKYSDV